MALLLLALEAALYPTLLAAVVIMLATDRPLRLLSAYLAGGLTISIGLGLVIVFALRDASVLEDQRAPLSWAADLTVGVLALLLAAALATRADQRLLRRRRKQPQPDAATAREPWSERIIARGSTPLVFVVAMVLNVPGAAYLIALKDIVAGDYSTVAAIALIVAFNLIMFVLAEVPLVGLRLAPERTAALVRRGDAWLSGHGRQIAVVLSAVLGAFLVVRGLVHA